MKIDVACYSIRILCVVFVYMVAPYREYVALRDSCHLYYWALQAAGMRICMSISFNPFRLAQIRNISIARVKFIFLSFFIIDSSLTNINRFAHF